MKEQAAAALSAGDAAQSVPWQTVKAVVAAHKCVRRPCSASPCQRTVQPTVPPQPPSATRLLRCAAAAPRPSPPRRCCCTSCAAAPTSCCPPHRPSRPTRSWRPGARSCRCALADGAGVTARRSPYASLQLPCAIGSTAMLASPRRSVGANRGLRRRERRVKKPCTGLLHAAKLHALDHVGARPEALASASPRPPAHTLVHTQGQLEDKLYASMVADITQAERRAASMQGMLPTYRAQLSFGAHVLVTMFTGFALGYWGSKIWLGWDELWVSRRPWLGWPWYRGKRRREVMAGRQVCRGRCARTKLPQRPVQLACARWRARRPVVGHQMSTAARIPALPSSRALRACPGGCDTRVRPVSCHRRVCWARWASRRACCSRRCCSSCAPTCPRRSRRSSRTSLTPR